MNKTSGLLPFIIADLDFPGRTSRKVTEKLVAPSPKKAWPRN
jgi:hypothetical protein